ncbi:MAG: hypothetical protein BMS9Abin26_2194 [Gammaproteobacteria bacterium]|nr:MAG: hypothetical protein BMS9Abin26_2194 [Gammaproteobacteria bacterium]
MKLSVQVEDKAYNIAIPDDMLTEDGHAFFKKMDQDLDKGWQMSMDYVESPNVMQRCQIVADKLYTAMMSENETLAQLMAGYIVTRMPGVKSIDIDAGGEIQNTEFILNDSGVDAAENSAELVAATLDRPSNKPQEGLSKPEAMQQAGKDVSKVYKTGRNYKFAIYDHDTEAWAESPLFQDEATASEARARAYKEYYEGLLRPN